jgi:hypothetical protein
MQVKILIINKNKLIIIIKKKINKRYEGKVKN